MFHVKPQPLTAYYEAQTSLLRLQRQITETAEAAKQAMFELRSAEEALLNYQGGLRSFLDKFSGKKEETEEALHRQVRDARARREALLREQEALNRKKMEAEQTLHTLPSREQLRETEEKRQWAALEAKYCAEALIPLLEENREALLEYRSLLRGEHPILSEVDRQEITARPNLQAKVCIPYLHRMGEALTILEKPFEPGGYFEAPDAWLFGVAAMHNRRDRLNSALDQVEALQKHISQYR